MTSFLQNIFPVQQTTAEFINLFNVSDILSVTLKEPGKASGAKKARIRPGTDVNSEESSS